MISPSSKLPFPALKQCKTEVAGDRNTSVVGFHGGKSSDHSVPADKDGLETMEVSFVHSITLHTEPYVVMEWSNKAPGLIHQ